MLEEDVRSRGLRLLVVGALLAACLPLLAPVAEAALVFKRPDGSTIRFGRAAQTWCGPWGDDVARRAVHVETRSATRGWSLRAVLGDVRIGQPIAFPSEFVWNRPRGAEIFAFTPRLEVSTGEEESSGSIAFSRLDCDPGGIVELRVRAVLGSELFGGAPVKVTGSYRGLISESP